MHSLLLWSFPGSTVPQPFPGEGRTALSASGLAPLPEHAPALDGERVLLVESRSAPGILAVLLVPAALQGAVLAGGRRAGAGMHLLRHGDRIDFAGQTVWISADSQAKEVAYDPAAHGEDTYCTRTKARLKPGEPIVLCPGTPQVPCGLPYRLSAWELALQCPSCKFDPKAPAWSPPPPPHRSSLDVLLQLAHQRA